MARTFDSPRHDALREFLVKKRKEAGLRKVDRSGSNSGSAPPSSWMSDEKAKTESAQSYDTCAYETIGQSYG
jgi:hypothetical protein